MAPRGLRPTSAPNRLVVSGHPPEPGADLAEPEREARPPDRGSSARVRPRDAGGRARLASRGNLPWSPHERRAGPLGRRETGDGARSTVRGDVGAEEAGAGERVDREPPVGWNLRLLREGRGRRTGRARTHL